MVYGKLLIFLVTQRNFQVTEGKIKKITYLFDSILEFRQGPVVYNMYTKYAMRRSRVSSYM